MVTKLKTLAEQCEDLRQKCSELERENARLMRQIEGYVCEFRVCRFCAHIHEDCSPTGGNCRPKWRGL